MQLKAKRLVPVAMLWLISVPMTPGAQSLYDPDDSQARSYRVMFDKAPDQNAVLEFSGRSFRLDIENRSLNGYYYRYQGLLLLWDVPRRSHLMVSVSPSTDGEWLSCWGKDPSSVRRCDGRAESARLVSVEAASVSEQATGEPEAVPPADAGNVAVDGVPCTASKAALKVAIIAATNRTRARARSCGGTSFPATGSLRWNTTLAKIAENHSHDMFDNNFFDHTGSDGLKSPGRASSAGYSYRTIGENIAAGLTTVGTVQSGWENSAGHCRNLMNPTFDEMGAACVTGSRSEYSSYWTVVLGAQR